MSIAIGYEKPFIGNDVFSGSIENRDLLFEGNKESLMGALNRFFNNETSFLDYIKKLKQGRTWYVIGNKTYYVYKKLVCKL
jgi:gamma-glutamylcysteine synthetase